MNCISTRNSSTAIVSTAICEFAKRRWKRASTIADFAHHDLDQKTRFLPGYVIGKEEPFTGRLPGMTTSYEFTERGKPMAGRTYHLQADPRTVYVLRFTGLRDKLLRIRNQTDSDRAQPEIEMSLELKL